MAVISAPPREPRTSRGNGLIIVLVVIIAMLAAVIAALLTWNRHWPGSQLRGSGVAATQARTLSSFTKVDLAGSNNVTVTVGGRQSVVVHADNNLLRHVTTQVASGTLTIGTTGSFTTRSPMSVDVTVPALTAVQLSGSGMMSVTGVKAAHLTVTLPGSGILRASGTVTRLDVALSGSGEALFAPLIAGHVRATVSGSGLIRVTATASLDAVITGSGAITYSGNPAHVATKITGSGAVTPG